LRRNILHITPDFNYACGRSYYVFLLLKYLKDNHNVYLITNGGDSFDRLDEIGIEYKIIKGLNSKNPISFANNVNQIRSFIKEKKINIIHTHHRYPELLAQQAKKLIATGNLRTVITSLSLVNKRYKVEYKSDKIIAVSTSIKRMLTEKFRVDDRKISVIPNFTDTNEIHELEILAPMTRDHGRFFNILALGRFHHEKNFEVLLKALNLLNDKTIELILVGEGDNDIDYKKYIAQHNLNVEIIVPQKNLIQYFLVADLCILPSVKDPFPNFMLQAGLHKKPFIGANVDGIGELINDGENGLLFTSGNEHELAEKIKRIKNDKSLAGKCAENLHKDVVNNYTQEFIIPKVEQLYNDITN
jgi:glycosyltransferase involved in cell wall biosynthesis